MTTGDRTRSIALLLAYMSPAECRQFQAIGVGLANLGGFEVFGAALSLSGQQLSRGIPERALDQERPPHLLPPPPESRGWRRFWATWKERDPILSARLAARILRNAFHWHRRHAEAIDFLKRHGIQVVITGNDNTQPFLPILSAAATLGVKVILARSANIVYHEEGNGGQNNFKYSMRGGMHEMLIDRPRSVVEALCNRFFSWCWPDSVASTVYGRLTYYPSSELISLALARCYPGSMWHLGTAWTDAVIVSGDDEQAAAMAYGIPEAKIAAIGSVVFDNIHNQLRRRDALRREVAAALGLAANRPIIMVTVTVFWEHLGADRHDQFEYLERLFGLLCATGAQVIASLHPLSRREDYQPLAEKFGFVFLDRLLFDCVSIADVFIGSDRSSVLRWAMAAGVPTMNMEFNPTNSVMKTHPDYPTCLSFESFERWLHNALTMAPLATETLLSMNPDNLPMGLIRDGQFFPRLAGLIGHLVSRDERQPIRAAQSLH